MTGKFSPVVYVQPVPQVSDSQLLFALTLKVDNIKNRTTMQKIVHYYIYKI